MTKGTKRKSNSPRIKRETVLQLLGGDFRPEVREARFRTSAKVARLRGEASSLGGTQSEARLGPILNVLLCDRIVPQLQERT